MSDITIKIENLSKQYRIGNIGTGTLTHDLKRWWYTSRGKEDPTLKIGEENKLIEIGGNYVYALKDINLEIKQGEVIGVIGKNGAGKSTLLKILSRITSPTTGIVDIYGRLASLLEVGTGFHQELSGRENIFLNGAIMGMSKREINSSFEEIVQFSGIGKYIDTAVKRYSSGMYVRLGFAIAAHLKSEILIVDEVLAVGDSEFQRKALGRMENISNEGRTVLFVSHDMTNIKRLCNKCVYLVNGTIASYGDTETVVNAYQQTIQDEIPVISGLKTVKLLQFQILNHEATEIESFNSLDNIKFILHYEAKEEITDATFSVSFNNSYNTRITSLWSSFVNKKFDLKKGVNKITFVVNSIRLIPDEYEIKLYVESNGINLERIDNFKKIIVGYSDQSITMNIPNKSQGVYLEDFDITINN